MRSIWAALPPRRLSPVVLVLLGLLLVAPAPTARAQSACTGGCNDQNPCTTDTCDPVRGCLHAPTTGSCSDGNNCTTNDTCQNGVCIGGANAVSCNSCQAVTTLPAAGGTFLGMTSGRSFATGSGTCSSTAAAPERVYRWTPATSGSVEILTCGTSTNFDTVVYVRRGSCIGQQAGCNDDGCANAANGVDGSRILMDVTAGQTYYVIVDGSNNARGTFALTIRPAVAGVCGDGVRQGSEQCDGTDGAASCPSGRCASNCTCAPTVCGDGVRQGTEQCDGAAGASSCASGRCAANCTCAPIVCGDGLREGTEQCDGTAGASACPSGRCASNCTCAPTVCGDGVRQGTEQCDGTDGASACSSGRCASNCTCVPTGCGDGVRQGTEQCDGTDGASACSSGRCASNCTCAPIVCGDGLREGTEQCDGTAGASTCPSGRCASSCTCAPIVCGDGLREGTEQCDGTAGASTCPSGRCASNCTCAPIVCGDGVRQGSEQCDGNDVAGCASRVCTASCTCASARCGDGVRQGTEQCDGTDLGSCTSGCTSSCTCVSPCGAVDIPAEGGTVTGVTSGTNAYNSSCGSGATGPEKLFRWIAPRSGMAVIETCGTGTNYDTFLHVRQDVCTGQDIACNDDAPCATANSTDQASRVPFQVVAGTTYFIFVDGYNGARGSFALTVQPPVASTCGDGVRQGTEQCDLADAAGCPSRQCYPDCTCIPPSTGHPDLVPEILTPFFEFQTSVPAGDVSELCASNTSGVDLFRFGVRVFNRGTADLFLGDPMCPVCADHPGEICANPNFVCAPAGGHGHPHYENYAAYDLLSQSGAVVVSGHKQGFCLHDGFDAGVTCPNRHFDSCNYQGLSIGCADLYEATLGCQYVDITGLPSGNYTLRVTVDPLGQITEDNENNNVVTLPVTIPDASCGAVDIPTQGGVVNGVTAGANAYGSTCGVGATGPEKVFRWIAPRAGTAVIETCGSGTDYDTFLHLRKGACGGSDIACNDDAPCATANSTDQGSRISFTVEAGATYYVFVDGYNGAAGHFSLRVTPP